MANWEAIQREWETSKITLADLAEKHGVKLGTLKSRKSREKWSRDATASKKVAASSGKVATDVKGKNSKATSNGQGEKKRRRSGNPNPTPKFPKRNKAAEKHGMFSKYLPQETLDIMEDMFDRNPADLIWDQIQIQYAAIIRAQKIMFVEDEYDMTKELRKLKQGEFGDDKEWEIQFAWDKHATFLNAQSRAISELRTSIRQFVDMAHEDDDRLMKVEMMQASIAKTKADAEFSKERADKLKGTKKDTGLLDALIEGRKRYEQNRH